MVAGATQGLPPQLELTGLTQHCAITHWPAQQRALEPSDIWHSVSAVHTPQELFSQTWVLWQAVLSQQLPLTQAPPQQRALEPHSRSVKQSRQPNSPQTCPGGQSLS
jgi:hypothetical protein